MTRYLSILAATALLSACGGGGTTQGEGAPAAKTASAGSGSFTPTDACAMLPKEKVAAITGFTIESAKLAAVTQPTAEMAGFSTCNYVIAGGGSLGFFARQSPEYDGTPEGIARTRQALIDGMGAKPVDVPGLGTAAFSADFMNQLHVFFGGDKYIYFMVDKLPAGAKPILESEKALAKAVMG